MILNESPSLFFFAPAFCERDDASMFVFFHVNERKYNSLLLQCRFQLLWFVEGNCNVRGSNQKLVEWMEQSVCASVPVPVSVCLGGQVVGWWHTIFEASAAFTQTNLRHRWMKNFNKIQWLQSTWNTSKCTFKWFWFEADWYLVSRAKEHAWMCYTRIH